MTDSNSIQSYVKDLPAIEYEKPQTFIEIKEEIKTEPQLTDDNEDQNGLQPRQVWCEEEQVIQESENEENHCLFNSYINEKNKQITAVSKNKNGSNLIEQNNHKTLIKCTNLNIGTSNTYESVKLLSISVEDSKLSDKQNGINNTSKVHKSFKVYKNICKLIYFQSSPSSPPPRRPMTSAERQRAYRQRKKLIKQVQTKPAIKKGTPKTAAKRQKAYRMRKKISTAESNTATLSDP